MEYFNPLDFFFYLIVFSFGSYALFYWWRLYYWRIVSNDICLKAVKIAYVDDKKQNDDLYYYFGLSQPKLSSHMQILPSSSIGFLVNPVQKKLPFTFLKKDKKLFYLDKEQTIAVAIEAKQAGGGYLLDHDLTWLMLSKSDKQKFIANIKAYQAWIAHHPKELQRLSDAINNDRF